MADISKYDSDLIQVVADGLQDRHDMDTPWESYAEGALNALCAAYPEVAKALNAETARHAGELVMQPRLKLWVVNATMEERCGLELTIRPMIWIGLTLGEAAATGLAVQWMQNQRPKARISGPVVAYLIPDDMVAAAAREIP